jgi:hypothetical protein
MAFKRLERAPTHELITPQSGPMLQDNPRLAQWLDLLVSMVNDLAPSVGQDIGNADATLTVGRSAKTQIANSPLTAPRIITLATVGAYNGARFKIVRTAAATGSGLDVGGLKTLDAAEWCEISFNDIEWIVTAAGSL